LLPPEPVPPAPEGLIRIRGARQHNLKNLDLDLRTGELTVVTGPSGSGKSSLVFDTLYAEGQRRYVETFSAYARQFLDRMDRPAVDRVEGVPPAIAIDQSNPVRNSRSTVGTMSELNDHLKLLYARAAQLYDRQTALPVRADHPDTLYAELLRRSAQEHARTGQEPRLLLTFPVQLPASSSAQEVEQWLSASGYTRVLGQRQQAGSGPDSAPVQVLDVVADRLLLSRAERARVLEAIERCLEHGAGRLNVYLQDAPGADSAPLAHSTSAADSPAPSSASAAPTVWRFSTGLHCPESDMRYAEPLPAHFSFNSALGACPSCRGFGRVIGIDWGLVIPDEKRTLRAGAIKPIQTPAYQECQDELLLHAEAAGIPRDTPWMHLSPAQRHWVLEGDPGWRGDWKRQWYGIRRFFDYLESKAYKMHIRVLLSKYRSYTECPACQGARLKPEGLLWRLGSQADADAVLPPEQRFTPPGVAWSRAQLEALPGLCLHDLMRLPLQRLRVFFARLAGARTGFVAGGGAAATGGVAGSSVAGSDSSPATPPATEAPILGAAGSFTSGSDSSAASSPAAAAPHGAPALKLLLDEICTRLQYLCEVGLGYLTLDRQSRTLSGGEVQRINLTTALGSSLVNTLFVLDEPSIGLHPRDMGRILQAMQRLRDAGNTLVVVEHDPALMLAADRVIDMGPGPGARGGQIVFDGPPSALGHADTLTGAYLGGRKQVGFGFKRMVTASTPRLQLRGVRAHNLQAIDVDFPLQRLVCVTGVSGSGKSTLIQDVLAPALQRHFGQPTDAPLAHDALLGAERLSAVVFIDQSPIGKTARSNPASYLGAWDALRALLAAQPLARQRGYTAAKFSFNGGDGRCPGCGGSGFERVEMQFLSDVYLRCPDCLGKRYRPEVLEVCLQRGGRSLNAADLLELTVSEALQLFGAGAGAGSGSGSGSGSGLGVGVGTDHSTEPQADQATDQATDQAADQIAAQPANQSSDPSRHSPPAVDPAQAKLERAFCAALQPLVDVGLEYLKLGQPVPTLSGGEAQRLKLAAHLAIAAQTDAATAAAARRRPARPGAATQQPASPAAHTAAASSATASSATARTKIPPPLGQLLLFDEPTTGLHFDDIAKLMRALRKLVDAGHSLIVIEHNLDVIRASDWLIDLGPDAGADGGLVVAQGPPEEVRLHPSSHTAAALRAYAEAEGLRAQEPPPPWLPNLTPAAATRDHAPSIQIVNAKEHNLKNLSLAIPRGRFSVITGVSGSGKSTLAFDILFNEGQRRYLESLNAYARSIVQPAGRPEVDAVHGIPPTVAIEQRLSRGGRKSSVGTVTEVWHYLRLLYVKLGTQHCVHDDSPVQPQSPAAILGQLMGRFRGQHIGLLAPLVRGRKGLYTELADWARQRGYSHLRVDGEFVPTQGFPKLERFREHQIELPVGSLEVQPEHEAALRELIERALEHGKGVLQVLSGIGGPDDAARPGSLAHALAARGSGAGVGQIEGYSTLRACPLCSSSYAELDPRLFSYNSKHGWCPDCVGTGVQLNRQQRAAFDDSRPPDDGQGREQSLSEPDFDDLSDQPCGTCGGSRLNPVARAVKFQGRTITELARLSVHALHAWVQALPEGGTLSAREAQIARDLLPEILSRLRFLQQVGLGYLTLERGAPTLSGGEAQRIRLAAQLGSSLQGVCYVLDEPTIGLHPRDNRILLDALQQLGRQGNTLVVVEHDEDTIRRAEHLIDIGPGAGVRGGQVVAQGSVADLMAAPDSQTGRYLLHAMRHPLQARRWVASVTRSDSLPAPTPSPPGATGGLTAHADSLPAPDWLLVKGAQRHNLQQLTLQLPLRRLVAVTGVSGSGKSTLAREVLLANAASAVQLRSTQAGRRAWDAGERPAWQGCQGLIGSESIERVLEVDQTPIGKTPRSCPATYIGFWDTIRKLYAETLEARARGYGPARFSFNTGAGRCPHCEGQGLRTIAMSFLPDVKLPCEVCHGARFNPDTLAVSWRGRNVGEVLRMEVDQALGFFASMPSIAQPLQLLHDVGLGYLTLGQPSPTLSGGEAQRLKLVTELSKVRHDLTRRGLKIPHTLYVLDEPTVGLHMADVERLIRVLHRLVDGGHSVLVIEHDLDLIAEADWVLDLGPEGGQDGGRLVAQGTPEDLVCQGSHTGIALAPVLARGAAPPPRATA